DRGLWRLGPPLLSRRGTGGACPCAGQSLGSDARLGRAGLRCASRRHARRRAGRAAGGGVRRDVGRRLRLLALRADRASRPGRADGVARPRPCGDARRVRRGSALASVPIRRGLEGVAMGPRRGSGRGGRAQARRLPCRASFLVALPLPWGIMLRGSPARPLPPRAAMRLSLSAGKTRECFLDVAGASGKTSPTQILGRKADRGPMNSARTTWPKPPSGETATQEEVSMKKSVFLGTLAATTVLAGFASAATLDDVKARGELICGV